MLEFLDAMQDAHENMLKRESAIKALKEILENGHGGGNWRRLIIEKIAQLENRE